MDITSILIGFLIVTATGAAGSYFGTKYTEKRQKKEHRSEVIAKLKTLEDTMPKLLKEMREDLQEPSNKLKREFVLLKKTWTYNSSEPGLRYYYTDHSELNNMMKILEENNFIVDVTENEVKKYRFNSEFVEFLQNTK